MSFKDYYKESTNNVLMSVDIQPEYFHKNVKYGGFNDAILSGFINSLNSDNYDRKIVFYNGDSMGMTSESDYQYWLIENGLEEDRLTECVFFDKGYAFFRFAMDSGIDEDDIVDLVKFMYHNNINDSRQIKESELWDKFIKEYNRQELRELLEDADDCISIPDLMEKLKWIHGNIELIGGGAQECLREVEIALKALDKKYTKNGNLIYEIKMFHEEYQGEHEAPDKSNGAPFHNVEGIYPKDFYSANGRQYYATEEGDVEAYYLVTKYFNHPNRVIRVYRATPKGIKTINKGDWVTPIKKYAIEHGKDNLNGSYSIISKVVQARDLFTDGNSLVEWGYDPQPYDPKSDLNRRFNNTIKTLDRMINGEKIIGLNKNQEERYYNMGREELEKIKNDYIEKTKPLL